MTLNPFQHNRDAKKAIEKAEETLAVFQAKADEREPRVNALWNWMQSRRIANGVGHDFEWDLSNPRQFRGKRA